MIIIGYNLHGVPWRSFQSRAACYGARTVGEKVVEAGPATPRNYTPTYLSLFHIFDMELVTAVRTLCNASDEELSQLSNINLLRSKLKPIRKQATNTTTLAGRLNERLDELTKFCEGQTAEGIVGENFDRDYRIVDIRLVEGRSRPKNLQAEIRRVMAERSLACDYDSLHPARLTNVESNGDLRGARNSDTFRSFASKYFARDVQDIVCSAIRSGVKLLALEREWQSSTGNSICLIGLFAIAYRHFTKTKLADIQEQLNSDALSEAIQVASDTSSVMFNAFEVYRNRGSGARASKRRCVEPPNSRGG
jgi:hypothetical protein